MTHAPTWLADAALQAFFAATQAAGGEVRVVGGAVRDFLLGAPEGDIDCASTLLPAQTIAVAKACGWKAIPTGIDHGTVTLGLPTRVIEVTTLRRDVQTDGRHAVVAFTDRFEEDAARRDFTINALYMDAQGALSDYYNGVADIHAGRVRFIGDAVARIREDGLRILRYFRFFARFGAEADAAALAACTAERALLSGLSGERIATEMTKLLAAPSPLAALEAMEAAGLAPLLTAVPWECKRLRYLMAYERDYQIPTSPWLRLLSLIPPAQRAEMAVWVGERWKLSRADRQQLSVLALKVDQLDAAQVKAWLCEQPRGLVIARIALVALDNDDEVGIAQLLQLAQEWAIPEFPITAADLLSRGFTEGKALGDQLRLLEQAWAKSDYQLSKEALLATVTAR